MKRLTNVFVFLIFSAISLHAHAQVNPKNLAETDSAYFAGHWKIASDSYKKFLGDTSKNTVLWQRLGYANQMLGNWAEASKYYQKSFKLNPPPQLRFYMIGNILYVYDQLNQPAEALSFLKQLVDSTGYANFKAFESLKMFASSKETPAYKAVLETAQKNAYPCLSGPHRNDFNFWVGEWDVYAAGTDAVIGKSSITKEDGGCLIIEHFQSTVAPQSGHSINYYDAQSGKWEQVYVGTQGAQQRYINGEYRDSAMRFTYEALTPQNKKLLGNFIFFDEGPNQFRQYNEFSTDGGKSYQVSYNFTYKRKQKQ